MPPALRRIRNHDLGRLVIFTRVSLGQRVAPCVIYFLGFLLPLVLCGCGSRRPVAARQPTPPQPPETPSATEEAAIPNPSRSLATGGRRVTRKAIARPAASSTITVQARKMPNAGATRCRTSSGIWFFVNASCVSAHTITGAAPALATATSVTVRRRSGTIHSHSKHNQSDKKNPDCLMFEECISDRCYFQGGF